MVQTKSAATWRDSLREIGNAQAEGRLNEAIDLNVEVIASYPTVLTLRAKHLQLLLKARHTDKAAEAAQQWPNWPKLDARTAKLVAISLARGCLLYTSPSPRDRQKSRMPSSA